MKQNVERERVRLEAEHRERERLEAERREQERLEAECREQERLEVERQLLSSQLKKAHLRKLKHLEAQYCSEKQSLSDELSQVENLLREKEIHLSKLSFFRFMEKRTLKADLDELNKKKENLILLIQENESKYIEQCEKERLDFNSLEELKSCISEVF